MATNPYFWFGLLLLTGLILIARITSSFRQKDHIDAMRLKSGLRGLDPGDYSYFHDLELPLPHDKGNLGIDHVVVSPYGIFVIETIDQRGNMLSTAIRSLWPKWLRTRRRDTPNPLDSIIPKVAALIDFLDLPIEVFRPLAYIIGDTPQHHMMPDNVLNHDLIPWIRKHGTVIINSACVMQAASRLDQLSRHARPGNEEHRYVAVLTPGKAS